jgi:hypothetical protein
MTSQLLSTPEEIRTYQLTALKLAVKMESAGMKRKGTSANKIACQLLGLPKGTKPAVTLTKLIEYIG